MDTTRSLLALHLALQISTTLCSSIAELSSIDKAHPGYHIRNMNYRMQGHHRISGREASSSTELNNSMDEEICLADFNTNQLPHNSNGFQNERRTRRDITDNIDTGDIYLQKIENQNLVDDLYSKHMQDKVNTEIVINDSEPNMRSSNLDQVKADLDSYALEQLQQHNLHTDPSALDQNIKLKISNVRTRSNDPEEINEMHHDFHIPVSPHYVPASPEQSSFISQHVHDLVQMLHNIRPHVVEPDQPYVQQVSPYERPGSGHYDDEEVDRDPEIEEAERRHRNFEKMIKYVNILGHVDSYVTDRARSMVRTLGRIYDGDEEDRRERARRRRFV